MGDFALVYVLAVDFILPAAPGTWPTYFPPMQQFSTKGDLLPRGLCAMAEDILLSQLEENGVALAGGVGCSQHSTVHRTAPHNKNYPAQILLMSKLLNSA